jgi:protein tyrosine phosphatase (PTP) superfamily phosphohydrolase (DUF442 family)
MKQKSLGLLIIIIMFSMYSCSFPRKNNTNSSNLSNIVKSHDTKVFGNLFLSGQPDIDSIKKLKKNGIDIIINLREPKELNFNEAHIAKTNGLEYHNIPVFTGGNVNQSAIEQIAKIINDNFNKKILIHCRSGRRVSGFFAIFLNKHRNIERHKSLSQAYDTGFMSPKYWLFIKKYLEGTPFQRNSQKSSFDKNKTLEPSQEEIIDQNDDWEEGC